MTNPKRQFSPFDTAQHYFDYISTQVSQAPSEDVGDGDLTAALVPEQQFEQAVIVAREPAVICGIDWASACFKQVDANIEVEWLIAEGDAVVADQTICKIRGFARSLLTAERCALNFLQTLSGTATLTNTYAKAIADTKAVILDTRKTVPLFRLAQKYAVNIGGGENQRLALYDGVLIKENHIAAAGSITKVLENAFKLAKDSEKAFTIQIEVETIAELAEALDAGATSILLDNFTNAQLIEAVAINAKSSQPALLESSGGITLDTVHAVALTGVDRISTGALTKHVRAIDFSMRFIQ